MPFRHAREILDYWQECPPENELLALLAQVYTTWRPSSSRAPTPEERQASLEARWRSGQFLNPEQLFKVWGGRAVKPGDRVPGVGPLPGM